MARQAPSPPSPPASAADSKFWAVFNFSPAAIAIRRLSDLRYTEVNQAWLAVTGFTAAEVIDRTADELNLIDNYLLWRRRNADSAADKGLEEVSYRTKDGQIRTGLWTFQIIDIDAVPSILTAFIDITERKELEREMARLDRLNLIGEMVASLGHEVRNPITTVRGFLQLFRRKEQYAGDRDIIDLMLAEIDRASGIIREFLSLAKSKSVILQPGNLSTVLTGLAPLLQADVLRRGHQLIIEPGRVHDTMICENEIQQLILNLACNSFEAMDAPGTVTIKTACKRGKVLLTVHDTGSGIPADILENIGTPFLTTKPNGTGLGLPVCYRIAHRHHARISVDTGPAGTTFTVAFKPVAAGCPASQETPPS